MSSRNTTSKSTTSKKSGTASTTRGSTKGNAKRSTGSSAKAGSGNAASRANRSKSGGDRSTASGGRSSGGSRRSDAARSTGSRSTGARSSAVARDVQVEPAGTAVDGTLNDITGVIISVFAIAILIALVMPGGAVFTSWVSNCLFSAFGVGAYAVPVALLVWGVSFFLDLRGSSTLRVGLGIAIILVAVISCLALYTPDASKNLNLLFQPATLKARGGYLGAGVAWCLLKLFGRIIGTIIMVGCGIAGCVVIGFSISGSIADTRGRLAVSRENRAAAQRMEPTLARGRYADRDASGGRYATGGFYGDPFADPDGSAATALLGSDAAPTAFMDDDGSATTILTDDEGGAATAYLGATPTTRLTYGTRRPHGRTASQVSAPDLTTAYQTGGHYEATSIFGDPFGADDDVTSQGSTSHGRDYVTASEFAGRGGTLTSGVGFADDAPYDDAGNDAADDDVAATAYAGDTADGFAATTALLLDEFSDGDDDVADVLPVGSRSAAAAGGSTATGTRKRSRSDAKSATTTVAGSTGRGKAQAGDDEDDSPAEFAVPPAKLLPTTPVTSIRATKVGKSEIEETARKLQETLESFNLYAEVVDWVAGPTFTMFKVEMPTGVRLTKITGLQDDIALALAAESVRIFAPIPGTSLVGIEIPNKKQQVVLLGDVLASTKQSDGPLTVAIGKNVEGEMILADLAKMPHLLIGGTTGSGKSVCINSMLMSILMRATPEQVRMILIDPKRVELTLYNGIPHLYVPVVTDPKEASSALAWATIEMDRRLKVFEKAGTRNIGSYNAMVRDGRLGDDGEEMPYIVVVIDELSDLMMVAGKEVEGSIVRIAQLARAAGIHLIVATQRPSANVVTGLIKANIINRIAFKVATGVDSRVILDQVGAEKLVGHGDMLFLRGDGSEPSRIQGCYIDEKEINPVVDYLKEQGEPEYHGDILKIRSGTMTGGGADTSSQGGGDDEDPLLWDAAEVVVSAGFGSTSGIQRRLKVGYSRAGRIMDQLEEKGVVGPPDGSKPREVLVSDVVELESLKAVDAYDDDKEDGF